MKYFPYLAMGYLSLASLKCCNMLSLQETKNQSSRSSFQILTVNDMRVAESAAG